MELEFTPTLKDGRLLSVNAQVDMLYGCDCGGELHPHAQDVKVESILVLSDKDDLEGKELSEGEVQAIQNELDDLCIEEAYADIERQ